MTHYEEFGIPSSASIQEIHQAHRRLIKILHPDLQTDSAARQLAETQTRRVNGIAEVLLDPLQRDEYDASLARTALQLSHGLKLRRPFERSQYSTIASFAVTGLFVLAGLWMLQSDQPMAAQRPTSLSPAVAQPAPVRPASSVRPSIEDQKRPPRESREVLPEAPRENKSPPAIPVATPEQHLALETIPAHPEIAHADPVESPPRPDETSTPRPSSAPVDNQRHDQPAVPPSADDRSPFAGTWVYIPAPIKEEDRKMYRPEYIEMRIRDVKGVLEGQYRARYHVPDRPLSPNVGFHFTGPPTEGASAFRWTGSNGLAGKVELKLVSAHSIQVDWRVTELADSADLVSGTAVLTRVQ